MSADAPPILELRNIRKEYMLRQSILARLRSGAMHFAAVEDVSIVVPAGTIFGLVGESGSGKSTLAQIIVRLIAPTSGTMLFRGQDVATLDRYGARRFRQSVQMVFQDTGSSLNPRKRVRRVIAEALAARGVTRAAAAAEATRLMDRVGLDTPLLARFPHELSGGQRQRVGIARALAMAPSLLIADEPVSALDVSLQGQIINLLQEINASLGLSIVLISHDLAVVARVCSALAVMSKGRIVESGSPGRVLFAPEHPYTKSLLAAVPSGLKGRRRGDGAQTDAPAYVDAPAISV
jgi:ABC-type glutathione transport system ATPase component